MFGCRRARACRAVDESVPRRRAMPSAKPDVTTGMRPGVEHHRVYESCRYTRGVGPSSARDKPLKLLRHLVRYFEVALLLVALLR